MTSPQAITPSTLASINTLKVHVQLHIAIWSEKHCVCLRCILEKWLVNEAWRAVGEGGQDNTRPEVCQLTKSFILLLHILSPPLSPPLSHTHTHTLIAYV